MPTFESFHSFQDVLGKVQTYPVVLKERLENHMWLTITVSALSLICFRYLTWPLRSSHLEHETDTSGPVEEEHLPILIVGAGPTGLTLGCSLARYGIPVRIIEKKPHLSRHTKATNLMQRTQEFMYALGVLDPLNAISGQMSRLMVHAYGTKFGPRTMHLKESPFTDVLLCGQHNFEKALAESLLNLNIDIEFNTSLTHLAQNDRYVTATIKSPTGISEIASFSYAIGCDGPNGLTRTFTELDFTTKKTGVAIRQLDCNLHWRRLSTMSQMWLFYFTNGFAVVVPLPDNIHRIISIEPKAAIPERTPTLLEMQEMLRTVACDSSILLTDPEWFSYTDLSMGIAPSLHDGRILLAGDAGNPVLPNGGQGMNTGIADSINLAWKLAAAYTYPGTSPARRLLATYNVERHAVRRGLQTAQFNSLKYTTLSTPWIVRKMFNWFMEGLLNIGGEYAMARAFSELDINTRRSPLSLELNGGFWGGREGLRAGDRALDSPVVLEHWHGENDGSCPKQESVQLYGIIYQGGWTLLGFSGRGNRAVGRERLESSVKMLVRREDLHPYLVCTRSSASSGGVTSQNRASGRTGLKSSTATKFTTLWDLDEEAHRIYGLKWPTLLLIRPDGHVGLRVRLRCGGTRVENVKELRSVQEYLASWIPDGRLRFTEAVGFAT